MSRKSRRLKEQRTTIGIMCEGETEAQYFKILKHRYNTPAVTAQKLDIKAVDKAGTALIKKAAAIAKQHQYVRTYVVFDRDDRSDAEVAKCRKLAQELGMTMLFSSACFEIWYLLHFEYFETDYTPKQLYQRLSQPDYFNQKYEGTKGKDVHEYLEDRVGQAVTNGTRLLERKPDLVHDRPFTNLAVHLREMYGLEPEAKL